MRRFGSFIFILLTATEVFARAGGGGGGHSGGGHYGGGGGGHYGGGGSGGGDGLIFLIFELLEAGPVGWLVLGIILIAVYAVLHSSRNQQITSFAADSEESASEIPPTSVAFDAALLNPQDASALKAKATQAFMTIQNAWSQKQTTPMRRFISDGVYQRFNAQFLMMNLLGQVDAMDDVRVTRLAVTKCVIEGPYLCVDLAIEAIATDQFKCEKFPQLNSPGGTEVFVEIWSFIRRTDYKKQSDLFLSSNCPQCAAPLGDKLMETARCPYCGSYLNNGEFDWVLAEITQREDYGRNDFAKLKAQHQGAPLEQIQKLLPDFSRLNLEDRASNAFLQILIAGANQDNRRLQKFCTPHAFSQLSRTLSVAQFAYDRLFVNSTDLIGIEINGNKLIATVALRCTYRRVQFLEQKAKLIDSDLQSRNKVVCFTRTMTGHISKGSVFANACSQCGATQKDSLSLVCEYCGASLNDPNHDWVLDSLLDESEVAFSGAK